MNGGERDRVHVPLTEAERRVLVAGMNDWVGPARPTDDLARALWFEGVAGLRAETRQLLAAIKNDEALTPRDWRRVLAATEVVFASDVFGSGVEWQTTTGLTDEHTVTVLRGLQRKLIRVYEQHERP